MIEKLKPCPFCGANVRVEKKPLWHGSHGYRNSYEYDIHCHNCGCRVRLEQNDTVYRSDDEAEMNAVNTWNNRAYETNSGLIYETNSGLIVEAPAMYELLKQTLSFFSEHDIDSQLKHNIDYCLLRVDGSPLQCIYEQESRE